MSTTDREKWSYTTDGRNYTGQFESWWEAALAGLPALGTWDDTITVGQNDRPLQPEDFNLADLIIEHVECHDDYLHDCASGWPHARKEQVKELDEALSKVVADWLDKHNLRPRWWVVSEPREVTRAEAEAHKEATS